MEGLRTKRRRIKSPITGLRTPDFWILVNIGGSKNIFFQEIIKNDLYFYYLSNIILIIYLNKKNLLFL